MFKKFAIAAIVVGAGLGFLHATGLSSYTSTAVAKVRGGFKKAVPLEFEIERLRHEVSQLIPEMKKNFVNVAEEMVAVDNLNEEIKSSMATLQKQKSVLLAMTKDILWVNLENPSLEAAIEIEDRNQLMLGFTENLPEAIRAFDQGRDPVYTDAPRRDLFS